MTAKINELSRRADAAMAEVARLDARIAAATAGLPDPFPDECEDEDERDAKAKTLPELRAWRRELVEEADSIADAIVLLQQKAKDPAEKMKANALAATLRDARRQAEAYVKSANAVDEALALVEKALADVKKRAMELQRALSAAGLGDNARISNTLRASVRWAAWKSAPTLAELAQIPHTPANKREPLRASAKRVIPSISAEA